MSLKDSVLGFFLGKKKGMNAHVANSIDIYSPVFSANHDPELNTTFMSAVNAHARHFSKIRPAVFLKGEPSKNKAYITQILSLKPNRLMTASKLYEIVANDFYTYNLSILFLEWDYNNWQQPLKAIWPVNLDENSMEFRVNDRTGDPYIRFTIDGLERIAGIDDLIILSRNANSRSIFGRRNKAVDTTLEMIQTNYEGLEQAIKTSNFIRFIIQLPTLLNEKAKKEKAKEFYENWIEKNKFGLMIADGAQNILPVDTSKGKYAEPEYMASMKKDILDYLAINEKIVNNSFDENEWQAYYEGSVEPLLIELEDQLTVKILTSEEIARGNKIRIMADRLQTASINTRTSIADRYLKLPVIVPNVICDLLFLPRIDGGDKPMSSLNFVQTDKQNDYQGVSDKKDTNEEPKEKEESEDEPGGI